MRPSPESIGWVCTFTRAAPEPLWVSMRLRNLEKTMGVDACSFPPPGSGTITEKR